MSAITVDELLEKPFSERTLEEKKKIISDQKPRPSLRILCRDKFNILIEAEFNIVMYKKINWLTACEKRKEFFCWPCLLMVTSNEWNSGIDDLTYVMEHYEQHEKSTEHLEAVFKLHLFISCNFENPSAILNPESNEKISVSDTDREILIFLIDKVCYNINETVALGLSSNSLRLYHRCAFLKMMKPNIYSAAIIDKLKEDPQIMNGLVDAITIVLKSAIEAEIKESTYATVILSEHILNKEESQISTVLRYLKNGEVCERFVGFINSVGSKLQHKDIAKHFFNVKKNFKMRGKVLALSVDGAVLSCPELSQLFDLDTFQCKYFIPSYFHQFGRVLIQSVSHVEGCELFFRSVREIESYFEKEDNFFRLECILIGDTPHLKRRKCYSTDPFIVFLHLYRKFFIAFFEHEQTEMKTLSIDDHAKIKTLKDFLENLKTIFLLKTFASIFQEYFDKNLNFIVNIFAINFNKEFAKFRSNIQKLQTDGFGQIWADAVTEQLGEEAEALGNLAAFNNPEKESCIKMFEIILNQISMEAKFRLKDIPRLAFCDLLNFNNLGALDFKEKLVKLLLSELNTYIDGTTLRSEIVVLKTDALPQFQNKSIYDVMAIIKDYDLFEVFSQVHKLGEFILTMPFLPPTKNIDYKKTKLQQIKKFSYIPEASEIPSGDVSVLCIENEFLLKLQHSENFYNDVIQKYCEMKKKENFHQGYFS